MVCRAVLFAITDKDVTRLLAAQGNDEAIIEIVDKIKEDWEEAWLCQLDKAWDGIHRCLTDGELGWDNGKYPLNHAILGGKQLHNGDDEIVALVLPHQVKEVADALQSIDDNDFAHKLSQRSKLL